MIWEKADNWSSTSKAKVVFLRNGSGFIKVQLRLATQPGVWSLNAKAAIHVLRRAFNMTALICELDMEMMKRRIPST